MRSSATNSQENSVISSGMEAQILIRKWNEFVGNQLETHLACFT